MEARVGHRQLTLKQSVACLGAVGMKGNEQGVAYQTLAFLPTRHDVAIGVGKRVPRGFGYLLSLCNAVGHRKEEIHGVEVDVALSGVTGATGGDGKEEKQKR